MSTTRAPISKPTDRQKSTRAIEHGPNGQARQVSMLENALWALGHGFKVLPLQMGGKDPNGLLVPNGSKESTRDEKQVREWWAKSPNGNVGINGGVIIDSDTGINSLAEAEAWREKGGLPPTLAVRTGRRTSYGVQYHYTGQTKTGLYELHGVSGEVRTGNTYGLAPGSVHPDSGERYEIVIDLPIAPYPADCKLEQHKKKTAKKLSQDPSKLKSGEKIQPSFRQYWLVSQCGRLRRTGLAGDALFAALCALRDEYCERPEEKTDAMLRQICESGEKNYGVQVPGLDTAKNKPEITVKQGEAPRATDEAEQVLVEHAQVQKIFQRSGELVRIIRLPAARKDSRLKRPAGTVMLEPMSMPALMETFERLVSFQRWDEKTKKLVNTNCPARVASAYLSRRGNWKLPVLTGTVSVPLMRLDGALLTQPGYDEETGLYLDNEEEWRTVAENPTRDDAARALEVLHEPFKQFPFVCPEDKAVLTASILTAIQRRLLAACPLFGFRAPQPRSGKSLLASAAAIIATGKPAPAAAVSPDQEELRKAFTAALREGLPIVNLDNLERALKSPDLAKILTEEEFQDRLLGESTTLRLPTNCLWTATGNNLTFRGDLTQRVLLCRIDAKLKQPEQREFQIPNLKAHLLKHRPELVRAALTILRAFHVAGRPPQHCPIWGGFEEWSDLVRQSLIWAGETDPFLTRETVIDDDPEKESAIEALQQLAATFDKASFTAREIISKATDKITDDHQQRHYSYPGLRAALLAATGGAKEIEARNLSSWLRTWRDRFAGDLKLSRANRENTNPAKWRVEGSERYLHNRRG